MTAHPTPARRALYEALQTRLAGHETADVVGAVADSLASSVGFAAESLEHADSLIDTLGVDMKRNMRENWAYLRSLRAVPAKAGRA